ncbi:YcaO-like family protein [compost metagenome]
MQNMLEPERELPLTLAKHVIERQIRQLSLDVQSHWQGHPIGVARVELRGSSGIPIQGCGKGRPHQAQVGALYEALEHFLDVHAERQVHLSTTDALQQSRHLQQDIVLPWLLAQPARALACQAYCDHAGHWLFDYPLSLVRPDYDQSPMPGDTFDYRGLRRYSSNDGSAIGASRDEAVLHAVNQKIERDALSMFLLSHYYYRRQDPVRWLEKPDKTSALGMFWHQAEQSLQAPIHVVDISNDLPSPTYLALRMDTLDKPHGMLFGAGASLDPWHAVHRAVSELVQLQINGQDPDTKADLELAKRHLQPFPRLNRCIRLDLLPLLQAPQVSVTLPPPPDRMSVAEHLHLLLGQLHAQGHSVGICEVFRGDEGVSLVNVVIPGLERFHVVTTGNAVCPGPRGATLAPARKASA